MLRYFLLLVVAAACHAAPAAVPHSTALFHPDSASMNTPCPHTYTVLFQTTKGNFEVQVEQAWAPNGAQRFYNLVKNGFYNDVAFFRTVPNFMVQFGIPGNPRLASMWQDADIHDDKVVESNKPGYITFATAGPNTRTTQVFINYNDNSFLDHQGFSPFGKVTTGMNVVRELYSGYGDGAPSGNGPDQGLLQKEGNSYLKKSFPKLDFIISAKVL